jgi:hypothetical protein
MISGVWLRILKFQKSLQNVSCVQLFASLSSWTTCILYGWNHTMCRILLKVWLDVPSTEAFHRTDHWGPQKIVVSVLRHTKRRLLIRMPHISYISSLMPSQNPPLYYIMRSSRMHSKLSSKIVLCLNNRLFREKTPYRQHDAPPSWLSLVCSQPNSHTCSVYLCPWKSLHSSHCCILLNIETSVFSTGPSTRLV